MGCAGLLIIVLGGTMLLAFLEWFLAMPGWPWVECVWIDSWQFDYPFRRCTSSVSVIPDWFLPD